MELKIDKCVFENSSGVYTLRVTCVTANLANSSLDSLRVVIWQKRCGFDTLDLASAGGCKCIERI
jgi:hypothetical protein